MYEHQMCLQTEVGMRTTVDIDNDVLLAAREIARQQPLRTVPRAWNASFPKQLSSPPGRVRQHLLGHQPHLIEIGQVQHLEIEAVDAVLGKASQLLQHFRRGAR
jgi:hypothetical protein